MGVFWIILPRVRFVHEAPLNVARGVSNVHTQEIKGRPSATSFLSVMRPPMNAIWMKCDGLRDLKGYVTSKVTSKVT
jgi:hypothetical protein